MIPVIAWDMLSILKVVCFEFDGWRRKIRADHFLCRVMNGPLESIARELKFEGDTIMQGFVVSIFIVGAFIGSISGGVLADKVGRRRTFQIDAIPLILGAALRYLQLPIMVISWI